MQTERTPRQRWIAVLARAAEQELMPAFDGRALDYEILKPAETGTVMVEGRAGGTGRRFNLGEATVTRCVVRLRSGTMGFSYALGRDRRKAEHAALADALLQEGDSALAGLVERLAAAQHAERDLASRKAAATRVEFFTMVRGE